MQYTYIHYTMKGVFLCNYIIINYTYINECGFYYTPPLIIRPLPVFPFMEIKCLLLVFPTKHCL